MPGPSDRTLSLRAQLRGELGDFLQDEGFPDARAEPALLALVAELARYREEGTSLSPEVYLCRDVKEVMSLLQGSDVIAIGSGERTVATVRKALKECALLATGGWSVFIEMRSRQFGYGVFRATTTPLALTPAEALVEDTEGLTVVVIRKLADACVEVRGGRGGRRCVHFSAVREDSPSPQTIVERFAGCIVRDVEPGSRESAQRFIYRTLARALQRSHGSLAVVVGRKCRKLPRGMRDAITLPQPLALAERVASFEKHADNEGMSRLQGAASLLEGMLSSDGIVVFRTDGSVLGYRGFLGSHARKGNGTSHTGGARRRVFEALNRRVGTDLVAVLFRSQDGYVETAGA